MPKGVRNISQVSEKSNPSLDKKSKDVGKTESLDAYEGKESDTLVDSIYGDLLDMTEREDSFFPSGSIIIDSVLSNGLGVPLGKFISLTASEGVGKSSMCLHIARNCCAKGFHCLYIDTECGLNRSQLDSFSMLPFVNKTFFPKHIRTYGELDDLLAEALKDKELKFIFLDSLTDVVPDQVLQNNISAINQPGIDAKAQSLLFRKYKYPLANAGITMFFVLQMRTKIGMTYCQPTIDQGAGGHAVKHGMDISLELSKKEFLTRTVKGHERPIPYGSECLLKSIKNRFAPPMIPMQIQIIFGKGVSNSGAVANALILNGIAKANGKKYRVTFEGEEVNFNGKPKFEAFVKEHLDYYKKKVDECGGINLLPEDSNVSLKENVDSIVLDDINKDLKETEDSIVEIKE